MSILAVNTVIPFTGEEIQFKSGSLKARESLEVTGSLNLNGSLTINGPVYENVTTVSLVNSTASFDMSSGSFFTLTLQTGSNYFDVQNIQGGTTMNVKVNTVSNSTASFSPSIKQISESLYTPTQATSIDVLSFIAFDTGSVLLTSVQNLV